MKQCTRCGETKPFEAFKAKVWKHKGRAVQRGWSSRCRVCLHQIEKAREKRLRHERKACIYCKTLTGNTKLRVCDECLPYKGMTKRSTFSQWLVKIVEGRDRELLNSLRAFLHVSNLRIRYGGQSELKVTALHILDLLEAQAFACAICRVPLIKPCIDHSHERQTVRAILCQACNTAVGMVREDYSIAVSLARYIKKHELP